ncbi:hypothetical protein T484DRAFT_1771609 [Baffinella frigidus]|nr:hypothetical protein T484DRAFT_1771609 [Cryptophyta sp. CCMP2293]
MKPTSYLDVRCGMKPTSYLDVRCGMKPTSYLDVSIVIMDLKGFTQMSSTMTAQDLAQW